MQDHTKTFPNHQDHTHDLRVFILCPPIVAHQHRREQSRAQGLVSLQVAASEQRWSDVTAGMNSLGTIQIQTGQLKTSTQTPATRRMHLPRNSHMQQCRKMVTQQQDQPPPPTRPLHKATRNTGSEAAPAGPLKSQPAASTCHFSVSRQPAFVKV